MINNKQFTERLASKLGISKTKASETVQGFYELIFELLEEDDKLKIGDFLVFTKKEIEANTKLMPNGEYITVGDRVKYSAQLTEKYRLIKK